LDCCLCKTNSVQIVQFMDLEQASPATVSRCGMIYLEPKALGWLPLMKSWIKKADPRWREGNEVYIETIFNWLAPNCIQYSTLSCTHLSTAGPFSMVK
ncbi:hypothetical protein L9F63_026780, partial [Diploptera punctata]